MRLKLLREITLNLERNGINVMGYEQGKKHSKITISNGRVSCLLFTSETPGDRRAMMNIIKTAKHALSAKEAAAK